MRITVLGKSPSWQDADGACSGYLVEEEGRALLIDCGNGVFSKLRRFRDYVDVEDVLVTHLHPDHFLDLIPYACALTYAPRQQPVAVDRWSGTDRPARPALHVPPGGRDTLRRLCGVWGPEGLIEDAFALREYRAGETLWLGRLHASFQEVPHFVATHAVQIHSETSGGRFTFGADSGPNQALCEFARDSDLLLVEATLPRPERTGVRGHLTPVEAGEHGRKAGARRLVITHISDELDVGRAIDEAARGFGGPVEMAAEGVVYSV